MDSWIMSMTLGIPKPKDEYIWKVNSIKLRNYLAIKELNYIILYTRVCTNQDLMLRGG